MADLKLKQHWPELFALFFTLMGFLISVIITQPSLSYFAVFVSGLLAGRLYYIQRFKPILPSVLIILGFLVGYVAGSFWVSRFWAIVFFLCGFALSYYMHAKGIIVSFKSKGFIE
ncbi:MAG: hypothetical protein Q8R47_06450 [Nanoarchaeota archaeon]|nr:hypothetical protein [Nanoarchaeota archaeon]